MNPIFLTLEEVLEIHGHQIELYGGAQGIRDLDLLESAIAMPWSGFGDEYCYKNLYEMAAAYLYHITQNHPFVDGNKRTGAQAADVFLGLNDINLVCAPSDFEEMVRGVACGEMHKPEITEFFRKHSDRAIGESAKKR